MSSHPSLYLREKFSQMKIPVPQLQVVLGSGLSTAFTELKLGKDWEARGEIPFREVPGLNPSTAPGHAGVFRYFLHRKSGQSLGFQVGRLHAFEGLAPRQVVAPVMAAAGAGTPEFLLTNAAGSLRKTFRVGSLMIITDHVNLTGGNPLVGAIPIGHDGQPLGPRFPDMSETYDLKMRTRLKTFLKREKFSVNEGIYLGLLGPSYETPAEIQLFAKWGLGAVGMSTVWEAIALKHAGVRLAGLSFMSNFACGLTAHPLNHAEVEEVGHKISRRLVEAIFLFAGERLKK